MYLNHNESFDRMHEKVTSSFERPTRLLNIKVNTNQKTKDYMKDCIVDKLNIKLNVENTNNVSYLNEMNDSNLDKCKKNYLTLSELKCQESKNNSAFKNSTLNSVSASNITQSALRNSLEESAFRDTQNIKGDLVGNKNDYFNKNIEKFKFFKSQQSKRDNNSKNDQERDSPMMFKHQNSNSLHS